MWTTAPKKKKKHLEIEGYCAAFKIQNRKCGVPWTFQIYFQAPCRPQLISEIHAYMCRFWFLSSTENFYCKQKHFVSFVNLQSFNRQWFCTYDKHIILWVEVCVCMCMFLRSFKMSSVILLLESSRYTQQPNLLWVQHRCPTYRCVTVNNVSDNCVYSYFFFCLSLDIGSSTWM